MGPYETEIDRFLVEVFRDILKTEELYAVPGSGDLSLREVHLIEEVCGAVDGGRDNRASAIAAAQRVTAGTLTTVAGRLEKKGYLVRLRDQGDKRSVRLYPTPQGREAIREHRAFHREMVAAVSGALTAEELGVLVRGLSAIASFFREKYPEGGRAPAAPAEGVEF